MMNKPNKFVLALMAAGLLFGSAGAAYYVKKGGPQGDITSHAVRLQKAESDMNLLLTDLSCLQRNLALPQGQLLPEETQVLRARIKIEQVGIQSDLTQIVEDVGFLRGHWSTLTPQQKDLVESVQKNRT